MEPSILLAHAAATAALTGLIWVIQRVHYPLFAAVPPERFRDFEAEHCRRIGPVVAPLMAIEAGTGALLPFLLIEPVEIVTAWIGLACLAATWLSTALVQVPCHRRLARGFDEATIRRLIATNWIRTVLWTVRSAIVFGLLLPGPTS